MADDEVATVGDLHHGLAYVVPGQKRQAALHLADFQAKAKAKLKALAFNNQRIIRIFGESTICTALCFKRMIVLTNALFAKYSNQLLQYDTL